jgi:hypothetical protein
MEIPRYPESRPLELSDKSLFDSIFAAMQPRLSEYTFANLYLFRNAHDYSLTMLGDSLMVFGKGYDRINYLLMPLTGDIAGALNIVLNDGRSLYGLDDRFVAEFLNQNEVEVTPDRDGFDYLYLREELAELPGNRFHKKKNRINYFAGRHSFEVEIYDDRHQAGALKLLEEWSRVHEGNGSSSITAEVEANREALMMRGALGLEGVVVLVNGVVKGVALGERLNQETSVCHFEKADPFLEGVTQLVDREFNRLLFTDCRYVNREQDLGEPGLRAAKLSYHPVELVKKYRCRRSWV